jgi:sulfoxide reductase heme-binding subunit YedZ
VPSLQQIRLYYKPAVFLLCLWPLTQLILSVFNIGAFRLSPNPIEDIQDTLGIWGIRFIMITLAITPIRILTKQLWVMRFRRMFGLFTFTYVGLHFLNYLVLDHRFDFMAIIEDIIKRPFITVGFTTIILLLPLAVTSTSGWQRRLGARWKELHRLVYITGILACWHFYWQVKKDITEPLIYIGILTLLLGIRLWYRRRQSRRTDP